MIWLKEFARKRLLVLVLAFVVASFLLFPLFPVSQSPTFTRWLTPVADAQGNFFTDLLERTGLYTPPQERTAPSGRRVGGAGRGPICALAEDQPSDQVKALVAFQSVSEQSDDRDNQQNERNADTEQVGGLTIAANPTFWFYLPYIATPETPQKRVAQFVLLDDENHPVWNELMAVELTDQAQLVEYPLSYALKPDKLYKWYFSVICDSDKLSRNPVVRGWVQRIEPTPELQAALRNAPRFEQYLAYANNGIWFDTVSSLVELRRQFPSTNREAWSSLLTYFQIPEANQFNGLESAVPLEREEVKGNQLPARM